MKFYKDTPIDYFIRIKFALLYTGDVFRIFLRSVNVKSVQPYSSIPSFAKVARMPYCLPSDTWHKYSMVRSAVKIVKTKNTFLDSLTYSNNQINHSKSIQ